MTKYGSVEQQVMCDKSLSLNAKGLYAILAIHCGDKNYCWPSLDTLAELANMSRPTVSRLLRELLQKGHITRSFDKDKCKTYTYKTHGTQV